MNSKREARWQAGAESISRSNSTRGVNSELAPNTAIVHDSKCTPDARTMIAPLSGGRVSGLSWSGAKLDQLPHGSHRIRCADCGRGPTDKTMGVTVTCSGVVWHCFRCNASGRSAEKRSRLLPQHRWPVAKPQEWSSSAQRIWDRTRPLARSLGEIYLRHRGCVIPPTDGALRFLAATDRHPPSLCAQITDASTGKPLSLHFTRLAMDGRGKAGTTQDKALLAGHRKAGGCIRLWPDSAVSGRLALAEGIETALAAAHLQSPVWATVDAGNMKALAPLAGVAALTIFADHDDAGMLAAQACAYRWQRIGLAVEIIRPKKRGFDAADVAQGVLA